jgi:hypothetical protein
MLEKVILKLIQRHFEETRLLNAKPVWFPCRHSTTLQCIILFNNKISTADELLDIKKNKNFYQYGTLACCINYLT